MTTAPTTTAPSTTAARPIPAGTPAGPTIPPQKGGPFDPDAGIQVMLACAFTGDGVTTDAYKNVTLVADDKFEATYGKFFLVQQGIPVPLDRLL
jgi:hypothetical protein